VEEFVLWLQVMVAVLGGAVEEEVVKKYLRILLEMYEQVAVSIETMLDLKTISIEEETGRLTAAVTSPGEPRPGRCARPLAALFSSRMKS
jgi:hypothetical protein